MPLSEQDLARIHGGFLYVRDFDCLNGISAGDGEWPFDFDRHLDEVERIILAKACHIVHGGGCHEVSADTMPADIKTKEALIDWLAGKRDDDTERDDDAERWREHDERAQALANERGDFLTG